MIHSERFSQISNKHDVPYLCFNPSCPQSTNRVFYSLGQHAIQCSKWIVSQQLVQFNQPKKQEQITFQIFASPIQTILKSSLLEQSIILSLSSPLQKLKQQIQIRIDAVEQQIRRQVHTYLQPMIQTGKKIRLLMSDVKEQRISKNKVMLNIIRILQNHQFKQISKKQSMSFTPTIEETKKKIFETISTLTSTIFHPTYTSIPDTGLSNSLKHSLQQYLLNPNDDHQKKMFKISNLLKVHQTTVYERNQRSISQSSFIVRCPVCSCSFSTQRRKDIMGIWKNLCLHLLAEHVEEIGYGYRFGVETCNVPTTPDQVVYKMTSYKYQALQLIYKSGRKIYNFHCNNRNRLTIDLFPKFQQSSLPFPNITLADTAQIHIVVCSIAFHLQKSSAMSKPIYIYVCNYADISYLKKMIEILILKNVVIVDSKKKEQEEDTILYQDQGEDGQQKNWENEGRKMDVEVEIEAEEAKKEEEKIIDN